MKALTTLLVFVLVNGAFAQQYTFRVLVNKGQNEIRSSGNWTPVKIGAALQPQDAIRVSPNGYLGLVHVTGKPLEVKESGQYAIVDLAAKIEKGPSVLSKYTDFILSKETETPTNLTATGAVYRGTDDLIVFLPEARKAIFLTDAVNITWSSVGAARGYVIRFSSMFGELLHEVETADTTAVVNLNAGKFREEDNIIVEVVVANQPGKRSEPSMIKKVSPADRKRINAGLQEVEAETTEESALSAFIRGAFFEEHGLLIDAGSAYRRAAELEPDVPQYRDAYLTFLQRQALQN